MDNDIYKTPQASLTPDAPGAEPELATLSNRFAASIIDGIVIAAITLPLMYFTGGFAGLAEGKQPGLMYSIVIGLVSMGAFLLINWRFLVKDGQTLGKKAVKIRIVDMQTNRPTLPARLAVRYAVYFLPGQVPLVGQLFSLVNVLAIFAKSRRCLHDYAAGTRVVVA